ncbi:MAG TPA: hypothetical protein VJZ93_00680 [Candidatus Nanoarchaeia archaeon]|nr:hypothetical protein [Candidatus Nanoarchaeia archaeon]
MSEKEDWLYNINDAKIVVKPWGREIWLNYRAGEEVGEIEKRYVMKMLEINAGTRMSFQHHSNKREINYLLAGKVEAWYEKDSGEIEKRIVEAGGLWEIIPPKKHRTIALEDSVIIECSTPEVDDVIRHEDDVGRGSGRIPSEHKSS